MRAAMQQPAALAPAVIAVAQAMADGRLPLPGEAKASALWPACTCGSAGDQPLPAFLALLRRPTLEVNWLFGEEHEPDIAQLSSVCSTRR